MDCCFGKVNSEGQTTIVNGYGNVYFGGCLGESGNVWAVAPGIISSIDTSLNRKDYAFNSSYTFMSCVLGHDNAIWVAGQTPTSQGCIVRIRENGSSTIFTPNASNNYTSSTYLSSQQERMEIYGHVENKPFDSTRSFRVFP